MYILGRKKSLQRKQDRGFGGRPLTHNIREKEINLLERMRVESIKKKKKKKKKKKSMSTASPSRRQEERQGKASTAKRELEEKFAEDASNLRTRKYHPGIKIVSNEKQFWLTFQTVNFKNKWCRSRRKKGIVARVFSSKET